jgi:hypothetical protein
MVINVSNGKGGKRRYVMLSPNLLGDPAPERVLSTLIRGVFLGKLVGAHKDGRLQFFSDLANLAEPKAFSAYLASL